MLHTHNQIVSGEYDFNKDSTGGVVGNIDLLVPLPENALVKNFWVNPLVAPTSGGAATISFDVNVFTSIGTFILAGILFPVTAFGGFAVVGVPILGFTTNANPFKNGTFTKTVSGVSVSMSIAGAALTDGRLQFWVEYAENNL